MDKIIFFDNHNQKIDRCFGETFYNFLDYAFSRTDYFMLVYVNYYGKGYTKIMKEFKKALEPFKVKSRTNPSWPGTLGTICPNTTYKVIFYRNAPEAKEILKRVYCMCDWSRPSHPQDLAFFKGNQCWFYSVGHEKIAGIIHASQEDIDYVEKNKLALSSDAYVHKDDYFKLYDEKIE